MASKSDEQIHREVLEELRWDSRVEETEVKVTVKGGEVTLTGTVSSLAKKIAASEAAHRVGGVLNVIDEIEVEIPTGLNRSDAEIALAVRRALEWDALVQSERLRTTVDDGWVTLEGTVDRLREREEAERSVRHLIGVRGVTNRIAVNAAQIDPDEIMEVIEAALERRAERRAQRILVTVEGNVVTIAGLVRSFGEKRALLGAVSHAPGVQAVRDHLRIEPYL